MKRINYAAMNIVERLELCKTGKCDPKYVLPVYVLLGSKV